MQVCGEQHRFEKLMEYFQKEDSNIDFMVSSGGSGYPRCKEEPGARVSSFWTLLLSDWWEREAGGKGPGKEMWVGQSWVSGMRNGEKERLWSKWGTEGLEHPHPEGHRPACGPAPQVACMQFINIVVHSVENMNFRVFLQYEFTHLGLDLYLEVSPASPSSHWDLTTRQLRSVALGSAAWVLRLADLVQILSLPLPSPCDSGRVSSLGVSLFPSVQGGNHKGNDDSK